jgi:hypothetical protein
MDPVDHLSAAPHGVARAVGQEAHPAIAVAWKGTWNNAREDGVSVDEMGSVKRILWVDRDI